MPCALSKRVSTCFRASGGTVRNASVRRYCEDSPQIRQPARNARLAKIRRKFPRAQAVPSISKTKHSRRFVLSFLHFVCPRCVSRHGREVVNKACLGAEHFIHRGVDASLITGFISKRGSRSPAGFKNQLPIYDRSTASDLRGLQFCRIRLKSILRIIANGEPQIKLRKHIRCRASSASSSPCHTRA